MDGEVVFLEVVGAEADWWIGKNVFSRDTIDLPLDSDTLAEESVKRGSEGTDGLLRSVGIIQVDWDNVHRICWVIIKLVLPWHDSVLAFKALERLPIKKKTDRKIRNDLP